MASRLAGTKYGTAISSPYGRFKLIERSEALCTICAIIKRPSEAKETRSKVVNQSSRGHPFVHLLSSSSSSSSSSPASLGPWRVSYSRQNLHRNYTSRCEQCT